MSTCKLSKLLRSVNCNLPALEDDPNGFCILHSEIIDKDQVAFDAAIKSIIAADKYDFESVFFSSPISFAKKIFTKQCNFNGATFSRGVSFNGSEFRNGVSFDETIFVGWAIFNNAIFIGKTEFSNSVFHGKKNPADISFYELIKIEKDEKIQCEINFEGAKFFGPVKFYHTEFCGNLSFFKAEFRAEVHFESIINSIFPARFDDLILSPQTHVNFQDTDLSMVCFGDTDIIKFNFNNVTWNRSWGRNIIYDELILRKEENARTSFILMQTGYLADFLYSKNNFQKYITLETQCFYCPNCGHLTPTGIEDHPNKITGDYFSNIEKTYRYLKLSYERIGDYKNSGDFHYGEMEMHRRASKWRWFPFYWYNFYWFLSGYGERPCRALGWLAGFLLALPLSVWAFGLDSVARGTSPGFLETFTYIFEKATFQRPPPLTNLNHLGRFISNLSLLIIPGQAALFLLALRNRLGRRR